MTTINTACIKETTPWVPFSTHFRPSQTLKVGSGAETGISTYVSIIYFNNIQDIFQPLNGRNPIFSGYSLVNVFNCLLSSYPSLPPYVVVPGSAKFLQGVLEQA